MEMIGGKPYSEPGIDGVYYSAFASCYNPIERRELENMKKMRFWLLAVVLLALPLGLFGCALFSSTDAVIEVSGTEGIVPFTIEFDGSSSSGSGGISTYHWTFGTGDEWYGEAGSYTYKHAGSYTLTLTVRDASGRTRSDSVEIEVGPAVWLTDENLDRIYKLDMEGNELASFPSPAPRPRGIAAALFNGDWVLYVVCQGDGFQRIFRVEPETGAVAAEHSAPAQDPLQLAYGAAEPERVWHVDGLSGKIYELNPTSFQVLGSFGTNYFHASQQVGNEAFLYAPQGLDWAEGSGPAGSLWYLEGDTQLLYEIEIIPASDILSGVQLEVTGDPIPLDPSVFPVSAIAWYDGFLWVADAYRHEIVQIDPATGMKTGEKITGFPGTKIAGLTIQK